MDIKGTNWNIIFSILYFIIIWFRLILLHIFFNHNPVTDNACGIAFPSGWKKKIFCITKTCGMVCYPLLACRINPVIIRILRTVGEGESTSRVTFGSVETGKTVWIDSGVPTSRGISEVSQLQHCNHFHFHTTADFPRRFLPSVGRRRQKRFPEHITLISPLDNVFCPNDTS